MVAEHSDFKLFVELAKPVIEPFVKVLLKGPLENFGSWLGSGHKKKIPENFWDKTFTSYLNTIYYTSTYLTTLTFPNEQTRTKSLYVPLTIISSNDEESYLINEFDFSLLEKNGKILLADTAGMGKSTLLKRIAISLIEQRKSIPVFVELKRITVENTILNEIFGQLAPLDQQFDKQVIYNLLNIGYFTILFDGYDEISFSLRPAVTRQMRDFTRKANRSKIIITSRPDNAHCAFSDFQRFYIKPLNSEEAFKLIKNLDQYSVHKIAQDLIANIKKNPSQVAGFLKSPFLVSLLMKTFYINRGIPYKKSTFYREIFESLYKNHDLSKDGYRREYESGLDISDFETLLRRIAFETARKGQVSYSKDEFLGYVSLAAQRNSNIIFKPYSFFEDITVNIPLFIEEGHHIRWAHKSFQEFFTAQFISVHARKDELLAELFQSREYNYLPILELLYEIDYHLFRRIITRAILENFLRYFNSQFPETLEIRPNLIKQRIALTFGTKAAILRPAEHLGFDKLRDRFADKIGSQYTDLSDVNYDKNHSIYLINETSLEKELVRLLGTKGENIFQKDYKVFERNIRQSDVDRFEKGELTIINDDVNNPCNVPEGFEVINGELDTILRRDSDTSVYLLDPKKCKAELRTMEKEFSKDTLDYF